MITMEVGTIRIGTIGDNSQTKWEGVIVRCLVYYYKVMQNILREVRISNSTTNPIIIYSGIVSQVLLLLLLL